MKICDHTSVGVVVWRGDRILLIERKKPPFGFAPPAGHVDDHGGFEEAAISELREEVGLVSQDIEKIAEGRRDNPCRRPGGTWHYWKIYRAVVYGEVSISEDEVKSFLWADERKLAILAGRTREYLLGNIDDSEWSKEPGLEPVWLSWFEQIGIVHR